MYNSYINNAKGEYKMGNEMNHRVSFDVSELDCKGSFCLKRHSTKWMTLTECLESGYAKEENAKIIKRG